MGLPSSPTVPRALGDSAIQTVEPALSLCHNWPAQPQYNLASPGLYTVLGQNLEP